MEPDVEQFISRAFAVAGANAVALAEIEAGTDGLRLAALAVAHGMFALDDERHGHLTERGFEHAKAKAPTRPGEPSVDPVAKVAVPGGAQVYRETFGVSGSVAPGPPRKLFGNEFFVLAALAAHGEGERAEFVDVSVLAGIERWRVLHSVNDLQNHRDVDGLEVPGSVRLSESGRTLTKSLLAGPPHFASLVGSMRKQVERTRAVRAGTVPELTEDERMLLAKISVDDPLRYAPLVEPATRAGLAGDPARAKAAYRALVERGLLTADPTDPGRLRPTLAGTAVACRLMAQADAERPAGAPGRPTAWQRVVQITNHQVVGALTAEFLNKAFVAVVGVLLFVAIWLGVVGRESKLARWVTSWVSDPPAAAGDRDATLEARPPATATPPSTTHGVQAEASPRANVPEAPATRVGRLTPDDAAVPGTLLIEVRVRPRPTPPDTSRCSENFGVHAPAGATRLVWTVSGGGAEGVRFEIDEDVPAASGPPSWTLEGLLDTGRDRTILTDLHDGAESRTLNMERLYVGAVVGATEPFVVKVYAR